ncbi:hypothetical protein TYRP_002874 [Tyrophagus putrescentiae]|nr:hypothetical protein TYRP_002874 [Tyrophagus putrescentiae]
MNNTSSPPLPDVVRSTYDYSMQRAYQELGFPYDSPSNPRSRMAQAAPPASYLQTADWRNEVDADLRWDLVQKLTHAIFPSSDQMDPQDSRRINLFTYTRKLESDMYNQANSREEYNYKLAKKLHAICTELQLKRHQRRISQQDRQQHPQAQAHH